MSATGRGERARRVLQAAVRRRLRKARHRLRRWRRHAFWGNLKRREPFTDDFGFHRGTPVDRWYIEQFMRSHRDALRGDVLEVLDATYTRDLAPSGVRSHVVDLVETNPNATIVADLTVEGSLPEESYDCVILTQTLQYFGDLQGGLRNVWKALRPGGVVLLTAPHLQMIDETCPVDELWRFTPSGLRRLLTTVLPDVTCAVSGRGNLVTATAFLQGLAAEDLRAADFRWDDSRFPVVTVATVRKGPAA